MLQNARSITMTYLCQNFFCLKVLVRPLINPIDRYLFNFDNLRAY